MLFKNEKEKNTLLKAFSRKNNYLVYLTPVSSV